MKVAIQVGLRRMVRTLWMMQASCTESMWKLNIQYRHLQEIKVNIYNGYPHRISPQGSRTFFCKDESCSFQVLQARTFGACFFCTYNQPVCFTKRPHGQQKKTYCTLITTHAYFTCDARRNAHVWSFYPKKWQNYQLILIPSCKKCKHCV